MNYIPYSQNQNQNYSYQPAQFFPQPQGNIYMLGSSSEMVNVPIGSGLSAAICLREGIMYLKTLQNGNPVILAYKLNPLEGNLEQTQPATNNLVPQQPSTEGTLEQKILTILNDFDERLKKIEGGISKKGGPEWQL